MKTKLTLALVALITSSAFAAIPKVLPEFKNEKQLAEWRDEMAAKHAATTTATEDHAFYTGKPYIAATASYAFKYRSYNPELARWTSEDPSGFPDGANCNIYLSGRVLNSLDPDGLKAVLWLFANPLVMSGPTENLPYYCWEDSEVRGGLYDLKAELNNLDNGNPKPHYLDDGDSLDYSAFSNPVSLAGMSFYDQIYIFAHGGKDTDGNLNGKWFMGQQSYSTDDFTNYNNVIMIYGCNPTDGNITTAQIIAKFKDPTKTFLYE